MGDYMARLRAHPGVPVASALTVIMLFAAGLAGGAASLIFWVPVLITARTQPLPGEVWGEKDE